ncbi:MAG TPA: acetyl-CoA decarbonylase/synthase complex subunit gamma [Bacillota bacterium]|nr:acetyl-CoA decarbonylase/synthase complex subunit gamma [Bacillota bacterium]HOA35274.1 acetyl-CoA decarbonylase/synthase complex subunit gamma [Bacillota bacterium]HOJ83906.1 acetyl-CoA decarbonylase/synthase complex subunit gamma [Bacillota bacterium]HOL15901.1 acetyl-CoA decarbonylase/synthase complex subunit gamma [Bacillota bacterium]HPZ11296.1 acetyl-CoA decarbonylase/synthase complex subunit gamma [Bacillota bacterium]
MGLTGLEIFKHLPKTNCKECGAPTCLAFAMSLASGKATLDACPYVTDEARAALDSAAAPPIKLVKIGTGDHQLELGDETELFRHDKRFFHPTGVAVLISDTGDAAAEAAAFDELEFDRVGLHYVTDVVAVKCDSGDGAKFKAAVEAVAAKTAKAMILICEDPAVLAGALEAVADRKPLLYAATADNYEKMVELAKAKGCPLAVRGKNLDELAELVEKIVALGYKELVLDSGARDTSKVLADLTQIRRSAIRKRFRPFGYPTIAFTGKEDPLEEVVQAGVYLSKYASIVVLRAAKKEQLLPLLSWRQNLFTDPQKPIAVEPKLYEVGDVNEDSPVYCTTNFSLTYFIVEGEVENSRIPSYILSVDTGGISVLTAYADNKFSGEIIAKAMKEAGLESKVKHKKIVIPGHVAVLKGTLEEESGWEVLVGPREAAGIPKFAKENFA